MRLNLLLLGVFAASCLMTTANAEITLATLSSLAGIGSFIFNVLKSIYQKTETLDPGLKKTQIFYPHIVKENPEIKKAIKETPEISSLIEQRKDLKKQLARIDIGFNAALEKYEEILRGRQEIPERYDHFRNDYESVLDYAINDIRNVIVNDESASYLEKEFKRSLLKFENVCISGMSNVQLLYDLYQKYAIATGKYFATKNLIYDYLEVFLQQNLTNTREALYDSEKLAISKSVSKLKKFMAQSSLSFYKCNSTEGTYAKFQVFQKYYKRNVATHYNHYPRCESITATDNNECDDDETSDDQPCLNRRYCKNKLYCNTHFTDEASRSKRSPNTTYVCVNDDANAKSRYFSSHEFVNRETEVECPKNSTLARVTWASDYGIRYESWVDPCECICEDEEYFVDTSAVLSNSAANKVVTGVKLTLKENTLFLQILEGKLISGGIIDPSTRQWVPKYEDLKSKPETRVPITWDGIKEFALTTTSVPDDRIVSGLRFDKKFINTNFDGKRLGISVYSRRFNFTSGKLFNEENLIHLASSGSRELNLTKCDLPTKTKEDNKLDSTNDQFLTLGISDLKKDAGQTTIPYIDVQEVVTNPSVPLKGIGLLHKGRPGFGGFMGLNLITYNITSQISEDFPLDRSIMMNGKNTIYDTIKTRGSLTIIEDDYYDIPAIRRLALD